MSQIVEKEEKEKVEKVMKELRKLQSFLADMLVDSRLVEVEVEKAKNSINAWYHQTEYGKLEEVDMSLKMKIKELEDYKELVDKMLQKADLKELKALIVNSFFELKLKNREDDITDYFLDYLKSISHILYERGE